MTEVDSGFILVNELAQDKSTVAEVVLLKNEEPNNEVTMEVAPQVENTFESWIGGKQVLEALTESAKEALMKQWTIL